MSWLARLPSTVFVSALVLVLVSSPSALGTTATASHVPAGPSASAVPVAYAPPAGGGSPDAPAHSNPRTAAGGPPTPSTEADWPMFLHDPQRTGANLRENTLSASNVSKLHQLWQHATTGGVSGSVAVVNGTAFFGAWDGYLYAVNVANGSLDWKTSLGGGADYTGCNEPGITATPAVWNGTVYIGGGNPWEYAVSAENGSILWHLDLANVTGSSTPWSAHKLWSSALVYNGSLYVGVASGCDSPLVRGALFQIGLGTHAIDHIFWTLPAGEIGPGIWSSPSVDPASNTIWVTTGNEGSFDTKYARSVVELNASNVSEVLGYAKETVAFADLDFGDGATLFHSSNGTPMVVAVNKNGVAYAFNESALHANGTSPTAWTLTLTPSAGNTYVPPAFDGSTLYFGTPNTVLPNGSYVAGSVVAVDPNDGSVRWYAETSSAIYAGLTYAAGLVIAGLTGGGVVVFDASSGAVLFSSSGQSSWGEPVVLNGELLVTAGSIYGGKSGGGSVTAYGLNLTASTTHALITRGANTTYALRAVVAGGLEPYTVWWNLSDGISLTGGMATAAFAAHGTYTVNATIRDARASEVNESFSLTAFDALSVATSLSMNPVPLGAGTWLNLSIRGAESPYTVAWSGLPPGVSPSNASSESIFFLPTNEGSYNVSVEVNSPSKQTMNQSFAQLWVDGPAQYTITATPSAGVLPLTVLFGSVSSFPGAPGVFLWTFGDGATSSLLTPVHTFRTPGNFTVRLVVSYAGGTHAQASAQIRAFNPLTLTGNSTYTVDLGQLLTLQVNTSGGLGVYTYSWRNLPTGCSSVNDSTLTCRPSDAGGWSVDVGVQDPLGGQQSEAVSVVVNPRLAATALPENESGNFCTSATQTVRLGGNVAGGEPPYSIVWSNAAGSNESGLNVAWTLPGPGLANFTMTVTDSLGVTARSNLSVALSVPPCPAPASVAANDSLFMVGVLATTAVAIGGTTALYLRRRRTRTPPPPAE